MLRPLLVVLRLSLAVASVLANADTLNPYQLGVYEGAGTSGVKGDLAFEQWSGTRARLYPYKQSHQSVLVDNFLERPRPECNLFDPDADTVRQRSSGQLRSNLRHLGQGLKRPGFTKLA